jgi:hypothetical protein
MNEVDIVKIVLSDWPCLARARLPAVLIEVEKLCPMEHTIGLVSGYRHSV